MGQAGISTEKGGPMPLPFGNCTYLRSRQVTPSASLAGAKGAVLWLGRTILPDAQSVNHKSIHPIQLTRHEEVERIRQPSQHYARSGIYRAYADRRIVQLFMRRNCSIRPSRQAALANEPGIQAM